MIKFMKNQWFLSFDDKFYVYKKDYVFLFFCLISYCIIIEFGFNPISLRRNFNSPLRLKQSTSPHNT